MTTERRDEEVNDATPCGAIRERLAEAIDGELPPELEAHLDGCDACRDRVHDATLVIEQVREAASGYVVPIDLEARVMAAIDARKTDSPKTELMLETFGPVSGSIRKEEVAERVTRPDVPVPARDAAPGRSPVDPRPVIARTLRAIRSNPRIGIPLAMAAAITIGAIALRGTHTATPKTASAPWKGVVTTLVGGQDGLMLIDAKGVAHALKKGDVVPAGARIRTDVRTRARLTLDDGTHLILDRAVDMTLDSTGNRTAKVAFGSVVLDIPTANDAPAQLVVPGGVVTSTGTKIALSVAAASTPTGKGSTSLAVARGIVSAKDEGGHFASINAGEGGTLGGNSGTKVKAGGLASAFGWSELGETEVSGGNGGDKANVPGLGELRARKPGATGDGDKPLKLSKQHVTVKIAGDLARTEIEETFSSDDASVMEGIFHFPLPPDAQIERLALDVDGKLEEGAFVDKEKGAAIWRGVLFQATPTAPRPKEEWVWVPGPWSDPALLEWRAGGRMELRIFPIPAHGSRRIVLAYTQRIAPSAGVRRYVYPLPHFTQGAVVGDFAVDVQVMGHDPSRGVAMHGYESAVAGGAEDTIAKRSFAKAAFVPAGDMVIEYAKKDESAAATSYAYKPASGDASYVALTLSPSIPRLPDDAVRTQIIVVDSSRSMVGERFARASALAARLVEELDPRDRFAVMACDVKCSPHAIAPGAPGKSPSEAVRTFLSSITPDGGSDMVSAMSSAASLAKIDGSGRALRVIYIGDGAPTLGPRSPATIEAGVRKAIGATGTLTAVAVGVDSDLPSLEAMARGGGGAVIPYVAGEKLGASALGVLEASYGAALRDVKLTLPAGLDAIAPTRLSAIRAGDEALVVARMSSNTVAGNAVLEGTLGGKPWSTTIPISVQTTTDGGNAFVPRLFAMATINELERKGDIADRAKIVEMSKTFSVPSRYTSLIVLESPAMAAAFGVGRKAPVAAWSGDMLATATVTDDLEKRALHASKGGPPMPDPYKSSAESAYDGNDGYGKAGGAKDLAGPSGGGAGAPKPAATATAAPKAAPMAPPPMDKPAADTKASAKGKKATLDDDWGGGGGGGGGWVKMRREWYRTATFANNGLPELDLEGRIGTARAAVIASPDSRDKLADLFGLLARREALDEAHSVMTTWTLRDPLDVSATLRRAELSARAGKRLEALRVQTGALEGRPDDVVLADGLAEVAMRAGDLPLACSLYSVRAETRPTDVDGLARRVACLQQMGDSEGSSFALSSMDETRRTAVALRLPTAAARFITAKPTSVGGDFVVDATWSGGGSTDVDLAVIDPKGVRLSWMSPHGVLAADPTSTSHESLALPWAQGGNYTIEVTRPVNAGSDSTAVAGTVTVRVLGQSHSYPFVLQGTRATVGRVNITWASRLVPAGWE